MVFEGNKARQMDGFLQQLAKQHPEHSREIQRLMGQSASFRAVCEDIAITNDAILRWCDFPERLKEYEDIRAGLLEEFWSHLNSVRNR
ncbi:hypothetical protein [Pseudoruegeria sp. SHC-113]|uniref:hypothetical protein n=1 Tax=Pseudoruegeria sp. SHC-113 TaxID=2855439 RepID=UPI0021BA5B0F|nr:hypothetical protein [Pseudoruegeria sp. SHC-113]MCT8160659.1 hypothetical protein [Pseudoruegeria sp. SHC-113]